MGPVGRPTDPPGLHFLHSLHGYPPARVGACRGCASWLSCPSWSSHVLRRTCRRDLGAQRGMFQGGIDFASAKRYNNTYQHRRGGESLPLSGARPVKEESPEPVRACKPLRTVLPVGGRRKGPRIPKRCRGAYAILRIWLCVKNDQFFRTSRICKMRHAVLAWRVFYSVFVLRRLVVPHTEHEL